MKKLMIAFTAMACFGAQAAAQQAPDYRASMETAAAAFQEEDWPALNDALDAAQSARPWSLYVYRNRILARMLAERTADAVALAAKAAQRGLTLNLTGHPAFDELQAMPEFTPIASLMEANAKPLGEPGAAREFNHTELLPEAIAFGRKKEVYIGSVRNGAIMKAGKKDAALSTVAVAPGGVFDLDIRKNLIWAAVNNQLAYENADPGAPFASLIAFDRKTGAPVREISVTEGAAMLGDLEVANGGTIYASDSTTPRIFRMTPDGETLDVFSTDPRFVNPQGIALDERNNRLFMADYLSGLFVIDTENGKATQLANEAGAHLGGIDGLYLYKGGLIGIQNGAKPQRIVYIGLNDDATAITSFITMHRNLEDWNEPTHGAVLGKDFHYIATSNWPSYDDDWAVKDEPALQPLRIMTAPLESK